MSPQELADLVADRSPRGIAATIARLVHAGDLLPGDRLPTVRELAGALGVSPATVGSAWQTLASAGLVISRGRAGTSVLPGPAGRLPPRYRDLADAPAARLDLAAGSPDPELLPDLAPALSRVASRRHGRPASGYLDDPVVPELERLLRSSWPFLPQRLTVVDGAVDALSRVLEQVSGFGDRVAVEDPGFPPVLDLLDHLGLERLPVPLDTHGPRPEALESAVAAGARVVILQPRAQNPTGVSTTPTRARELAAVLRPVAGQVWVVEDDHSGEIASSRDVSLGQLLPDRVVHVRSYSKSHGPDLRIAAVGGPAVVLDGLVARRMLGPGWTSRLLQHVLADLLTDAPAVEAVAHARRVYHGRQRALCAALARHGLALAPGDGINLWVPVRDEQTALVKLEAAGVRVARGRPFVVDPTRSPGFVRVTVGVLRAEDVEHVAAALAQAARA
ncbi:transcriptional regulator, GntR family with aminotransferase domain [Cellulomonas flavigena DSM 20109]|uniref:Transcriptional regulator, GntR family with aminotransferase domain n=1 Tax=Cellulomonas flavigena (strain ATCC 482 / DSM 20109 / BCRC 11376 / JCM 18109 / NBRC 3775 / NCIMB 8073 / NRS 134) TaxID=446466 RepID=D5UCZ1_CELFN|nr:aminotransferase class I/II-fold pyridoxal phosphate-dependent enzyme [Cellulomonas flavigena]ADG74328.1 transcriptional regulator, GntR family with aminotransferase domain [Cellulomonas flavigena DSM 20109]